MPPYLLSGASKLRLLLPNVRSATKKNIWLSWTWCLVEMDPHRNYSFLRLWVDRLVYWAAWVFGWGFGFAKTIIRFNSLKKYQKDSKSTWKIGFLKTFHFGTGVQQGGSMSLKHQGCHLCHLLPLRWGNGEPFIFGTRVRKWGCWETMAFKHQTHVEFLKCLKPKNLLPPKVSVVALSSISHAETYRISL